MADLSPVFFYLDQAAGNKRGCVVVYKALEFERKWASGGYFHHVKVPVLTFELLQSKRQLKFKRSIKHFNSLQIGDAGVIVYKKKNKKLFCRLYT